MVGYKERIEKKIQVLRSKKIKLERELERVSVSIMTLEEILEDGGEEVIDVAEDDSADDLEEDEAEEHEEPEEEPVEESEEDQEEAPAQRELPKVDEAPKAKAKPRVPRARTRVGEDKGFELTFPRGKTKKDLILEILKDEDEPIPAKVIASRFEDNDYVSFVSDAGTGDGTTQRNAFASTIYSMMTLLVKDGKVKTVPGRSDVKKSQILLYAAMEA